MAGPQTIQRVPRGLLDALAMKGTGDAPHELAAQLAGMFDLTELYLFDKLVVGNIGSTSFNSGTWITLGSAVPQGELWIVTDWGMTVDTGAGATLTGAVAGYSRKGWTSPIPFHSATPLSLTASQEGRWGGPLYRPIILQGADSFALGCTSLAGGTGVAFTNYAYYRLTY